MVASVSDERHEWIDLPVDVRMTPAMEPIYRRAVAMLPDTRLEEVLAEQIDGGLKWENERLVLRRTEWHRPTLWDRTLWHPINFWYHDWPWKMHSSQVNAWERLQAREPGDHEHESSEIYLAYLSEPFSPHDEPTWRRDCVVQGLLVLQVILREADRCRVPYPVQAFIHLNTSMDIPGDEENWGGAGGWLFFQCIRRSSDDRRRLYELDGPPPEVYDADPVDAAHLANPATLYVTLPAHA